VHARIFVSKPKADPREARSVVPRRGLSNRQGHRTCRWRSPHANLIVDAHENAWHQKPGSGALGFPCLGALTFFDVRPSNILPPIFNASKSKASP
jgi:hypothetical protein